jgi:hypothetical protein
MSDERIVCFIGVAVSRSIAEERAHRERMMAAGGRMVSELACDEGVAGHTTTNSSVPVTVIGL